MNKNSIQRKQMVNSAILKDLSDSIHGLAFGTVTIKVNHAKIVQIEVTENKRFDDVWLAHEGGGI